MRRSPSGPQLSTDRTQGRAHVGGTGGVRRRPRRVARYAVGAALLPALLLTGLAPAGATEQAGPPGQVTGGDTAQGRGHGDQRDAALRDVRPEGLQIGTAVAGGGHHVEADYPDPFFYDARYRQVLGEQFSSVSPENQMKWEYIHPEPDLYNFLPADAIVQFAEENDQVVRGHTLLWHSQNPAWLEEGDHTPEELRAILKDHIQTVVGHFKGRIQQWDVANEVFTDGPEPTFRPENIWIRELGPGIIADAFRWAHEADPEAQLFLNDYAVEDIGPKSDAYHQLAQDLLAEGVPLDGFAVQAHLSFEYPFPDTLEENLQRFADLGLETGVTELDVRMPLGDDGLPTDEQLAQQADWYQQTLEACLGVEDCNSFTIWGFNDRYSWVPAFFEGTGAATVMFEDYTRKPAYRALHRTLAEASESDRPGRGHGRGGEVTDEIVTTTARGGQATALTFDDGPDPEDTPALLDVLREHHVTAVFCLWGDHVRQHPELVQRIVDEGHTLCNHSMTHADMSTWTPEQIRADLEATSELIHQAAPGAAIPYFRAPYGAWGQTPEVAADLGLQPLGWEVVVEDWEEPGPDTLVQRITERITPRAVILLHDGGGDRSGTVQAVDRVVPELREAGWEFTRPAERG